MLVTQLVVKMEKNIKFLTTLYTIIVLVFDFKMKKKIRVGDAIVDLKILVYENLLLLLNYMTNIKLLIGFKPFRYKSTLMTTSEM